MPTHMHSAALSAASIHSHPWVTVLIVLVVLYLLFHGFHSHRHYRRHSHLPWHRRIWVSVPGPFGSRISKRV